MTSTSSAILAWATPVRPDKLGKSLEAYSKAAPTLHLLRLCHRFGTGSNVHITRIPAEIELAIESYVIVAAKVQLKMDAENAPNPFVVTWSSAFRHFEGNCAPMDHMPDSYSPLADAMSHDGEPEFCDYCKENYCYDTAKCESACDVGDETLCWTCTQNIDHKSCMNTCLADQDSRMNDLAMEWDYDIWNDDDCEGWRQRIDTNGRFAKHAKVLRDHFGLHLHFIETRIAKEDDMSWPRRLNHRYKRDEELKTTLCYLTLAPNFVPNKTFEPSDSEAQGGGASYPTAQAVPVARETVLDLSQSDSLRFRRVMNVLGLQPYLHPSQKSKMQRTSAPAKITTETEASSQTWPQLTLIVQGGINTW